MEVSSVQAPAPVIVQKKVAESDKAVARELIDSVDKADDSARQAKETGKNLDVKA